MIIGLCGYKGTGKSTAAEYLENEYGFVRVNFKDGLVQEITERFPILLEELKKTYTLSSIEDLFRIKPPLMRALMQEYGTDVRRKDDPDYWVNQWVSSVIGGEDNIVTDDVRFLNELTALGDMSGVLIRITRPDVTTGGEHVSEREQEGFVEDFTITGVPGSHKEIFKQIDSIIQTIKSNVD